MSIGTHVTSLKRQRSSCQYMVSVKYYLRITTANVALTISIFTINIILYEIMPRYSNILARSTTLNVISISRRQIRAMLSGTNLLCSCVCEFHILTWWDTWLSANKPYSLGHSWIYHFRINVCTSPSTLKVNSHNATYNLMHSFFMEWLDDCENDKQDVAFLSGADVVMLTEMIIIT